MEPDGKVDAAYCCSVLLTQHLHPAVKCMSDGYCPLQQDGAHKKQLLCCPDRHWSSFHHCYCRKTALILSLDCHM